MRVRFTTVVPAVRTSEMDDLEVRSEMEVGAWVGVVHRYASEYQYDDDPAILR